MFTRPNKKLEICNKLGEHSDPTKESRPYQRQCLSIAHHPTKPALGDPEVQSALHDEWECFGWMTWSYAERKIMAGMSCSSADIRRGIISSPVHVQSGVVNG